MTKPIRYFGAVISVGALVAGVALAAPPAATRFSAALHGGEEFPPRDTHARGAAQFTLSDDGLALDYKLVVGDIDNVFASHIHVGPKGANGPIVAFLYENPGLGSGPIHGTIADGTIGSADLVGPLAGHPLSDLIAQMRAGNTYVNVHTNDGVAPINTGPGDFPGGEIRGQIRPHP